MFWKRKVKERIIITLPEDFDEAAKHKCAINRYLCEHHLDDIRSGRIFDGVTYCNPIEYVEILVDKKCNFDLASMLEYIANSRD